MRDNIAPPRPILTPWYCRESAKYFLSSNIVSSLGTVASQEISGVLNSWVGRPSQAWTTIFRASEHSFQAGAFHQQCDGALPTIVIIKSDTGWTNNNNNTITLYK